MVDALKNDELVREAPAIVGRLTPSALAYAGAEDGVRSVRLGRYAPAGPKVERR
jgi:hypothetical protein